jgi:hypothetical protein
MIVDDTRPGFRRRIVVAARPGAVAAMLEDDIHCLAVTLRHAAGRVTRIEPLFARAPWTTCPGAMARLRETFEGQPLHAVTARRDKQANCTHLHDMAVLAAAHAAALGTVQYDILATDPVDGARRLELRRDGALLLAWEERGGVLAAPAAIAGRTLLTLRDWIAGLPAGEREPARLLQWASLVAHGRTMPLEAQSDATAMPPNCYTFQPERAVHAVRNGARRDFSDGSAVPLAGLREAVLAAL